ncbi:MAG: hypothetical protein R3D28_18415 [Geminicoccaceae bacterium]|jgi:nickel transport protein
MRLALLFGTLLVAGHPASATAHQLKLFATVEAGTVTGYGFFVGGGRAANALVTAAVGEAPVVAGLPVDADGSFAFAYEGPGPLRLALDAGEGHRAETTLAAERFAPSDAGEDQACTADADGLAELIEARVEAAVARQTRPLLEALAEAEARLRFSDVMAGIGMIAGIAGAALWATARRRGSTS